MFVLTRFINYAGNSNAGIFMSRGPKSHHVSGPLDAYDSGGFFCEMFGKRGLSHTAEIRKRLNALEIHELKARSKNAAQELFNLGITFTVYTQGEAIDRILPFDVIPRVLSARNWSKSSARSSKALASLWLAATKALQLLKCRICALR